MSALIIVIVNKDECTIGASHSPAIIDQIAKLAVVLDSPSNFLAISELGYISYI